MSQHQSKIAQFDGGQSIETRLTPNTRVVTVASGDSNNDTQLTFFCNNIPVWAPSVSAGNTEVKNDRDRGNGVAKILKGFIVEYQALSSDFYTVIATGDIWDSGSVYSISGKSLGVFQTTKAR